MTQLMRCSAHPMCKGPTMIDNHKSECPFGGHDDCDNETCWMPCMFCVPEDTDDADVQNVPAPAYDDKI